MDDATADKLEYLLMLIDTVESPDFSADERQLAMAELLNFCWPVEESRVDAVDWKH